MWKTSCEIAVLSYFSDIFKIVRTERAVEEAEARCSRVMTKCIQNKTKTL